VGSASTRDHNRHRSGPHRSPETPLRGEKTRRPRRRETGDGGPTPLHTSEEFMNEGESLQGSNKNKPQTKKCPILQSPVSRKLQKNANAWVRGQRPPNNQKKENLLDRTWSGATQTREKAAWTTLKRRRPKGTRLNPPTSPDCPATPSDIKKIIA